MAKKTWKIPVSWELYGVVEIEADTLEEALDLVKEDNDGTGAEISLPRRGEYVDGSFEPSMDDVEEIRTLYNNNQPDK